MLLHIPALVPDVGLAISLVVVLTTFIVVHRLWFSSYAHIPGPRLCKITSLWMVYFDMRLQRTSKVRKWHEQYGPIVLIAPGQVSFSEPSTKREIYGPTSRHPKSSWFNAFVAYGERSTFCSIGYEEHRERRNHSFAFFQAASIHSPHVVGPIRERTVTLLDQIGQGVDENSGAATFDLLQLSNRYAFDNITRLLYGPGHCTHTVEKPCQERDMIDDLKYCEAAQPWLLNFSPAYYLFKFVAYLIYRNPNFLNGEHSIGDWNSRRAADKINDPSPEDSQYTLLGKLQACKTKRGEPLSADWINAELLDDLYAAQMTVTVTLTYICWNLARNPQWQERIRNEIASLPVQEDGFPSLDDINKAPILQACVKESYRLNPSSSGRAERIAPVGKEYDGVFIPKGTTVSTSTVAIQRTRSVFPEPDVYNPNRWLEADAEQLRVMETFYMPFGYGARVCLGRNFANVEVKLAVAFLLSRYRISEDPASVTNGKSMEQLGTLDALPRGMRCDLLVQRV
ncbi:hypothetical protein NHJ13051_008690 [Beauveria bassiana]